MKLIALDAATEACSVALLIDGAVIERYEIAPRRHAELLLPMMEALLNEADLRLGQMDALAFGRGPGAFTGLRLAAGVAQGLAFGADLPVVPLSTLAALAQGMYRDQGSERVLAGIDARMAEVYWGAYRLDAEGYMALVGEECVCAPEEVLVPDEAGWTGAGTAWQSYEAILTGRLKACLSAFHGRRYPRARDIAILAEQAYAHGKMVSAEEALPVYLRDNVANRPEAGKGDKRL